MNTVHDGSSGPGILGDIQGLCSFSVRWSSDDTGEPRLALAA